MLTVVTPLDSAIQARHELQQALKKLAEAEVMVSTALATLDMFETNFRSGYYKEMVHQHSFPTAYSTKATEISDIHRAEREYKWDEVTGRNQSPSQLGYI